MTTNVFPNLSAETILRARWIADPRDQSGRRLIAVWERRHDTTSARAQPAVRPHRTPAGRPDVDLPSKRTVLAALSARISELATAS